MSERKLIPIYDATAPIACTIDDADKPERVALIERLRRGLVTVDRTRTGLLLHFADQSEMRAELDRFAVDEKRCCQFWGFAVLDEANGVALRWDGPPAVDDLLDQLHTFFTTDAPLTALGGLL